MSPFGCHLLGTFGGVNSVGMVDVILLWIVLTTSVLAVTSFLVKVALNLRAESLRYEKEWQKAHDEIQAKDIN
jgi:hypothetical protein